MDFRIFLAVVMELVMTVMLWMLSISIAGIRPVRMAMSSASIGVCHDLAKRLSHYLYFFSFSFLFLDLQLQSGAQESIT